MDGIHDLGGMDGLGSIKLEEDEPFFHEKWEEVVFGLLPTMMAQGMFNIDEFRHAIERMDPVGYLDSSYYEHWLTALETLLVEKGVISESELRERLKEVHSVQDPETVVPEREDPELTGSLLELVENGASTKCDPVKPVFEPGDTVTVRNIHPGGHTRCPQYVRRIHGEIAEVRGTFVFPDAHAHGEGEKPEPVYSVKFDGKDLWDEEYAEPNESLYIDLWESYLEPA